MNDALPPLDPEELDELLSADLDGELASAARDRGWDVDAVRARLAATPGASARRDALTSARDMLTEAPELDDLAASRLRAQAMRAAGARDASPGDARRARRNRLLLSVSGIAAAIFVVAAIAVAFGRSGPSSTANRAALTPSSSPEFDLTKPTPALGSYSDARALETIAVSAVRQRALARKHNFGVANPAAASPMANGRTPALGHPALAPTPPALDRRHRSGAGMHGVATSGSNATKRATAGRSQSCAPAKFARSGGQLVMSATAALNARPVRVYVFAGNGKHTVVVLGASCVLVNVETLS